MRRRLEISRNPGAPRLFTAFVAACLLTFFLGAAEPKRLHVVTTILPVYCFASGVVGTNGEVKNLLPPNAEPHDYQLSPSDLRKIKEADLIVFNGIGLDNWVGKALTGSEKNRTLELGKGFGDELITKLPDLEMPGEHKHRHDHQHGPANPHVWLDPQLAIRCVTNILAAVQKLDPANAAAYSTNAENYIGRLKKIDSETAEKLGFFHNVPFVVQHDAFPYLIRRYGLRQVGIVETTPDVPPSPRYLADLLKVIRAEHVQVIFIAPPGSSRLVKQIARDAKIQASELQTLESGPLDPKAYEQGMARNAQALESELGNTK